MIMRRQIFVLAILLLFAVEVNAKSQHGSFNLMNKFTLVVDGADGRITEAVTRMLDSLKCRRYVLAESCDESVPCFIIRRTPIETATGRNVFMNVSADGVSIDYNKHADVKDITDNISRHLVVRTNRRGAVKEAYLSATSPLEQMPSVFIDLSSRSTDAKTLRARLKKTGKGSYDKIYLMVFTNSGAGVRNDAFTHTSKPVNTFMRANALTPQQLSGILMSAPEETPVVMINLFRDNRHFREVTGHQLFSDEGMRFVDDFMKGLFYKNRIPVCQLNADCSEEERVRFVDPLVRQIEETGTRVEYNIINN